MALFESYDRRIDHINAVLNEYGINKPRKTPTTVSPASSRNT